MERRSLSNRVIKILSTNPRAAQRAAYPFLARKGERLYLGDTPRPLPEGAPLRRGGAPLDSLFSAAWRSMLTGIDIALEELEPAPA